MLFFRKCDHCETIFFSEQGVKRHQTNNKNLPCGVWARKLRKQLIINQRNERFEQIRKLKWKEMSSKPIPKVSKRPRGKPLTMEEKKINSAYS